MRRREGMLWAAAVVAGLALAVLSLMREGPLFLNLGAGDEPFARGFRSAWERDGVQGSGETMFRWTEDGARLEWPLDVHSGHAVLRLRLARFSGSPAEIALLAGGRVVERWTQKPRGWQVRRFDLGELRGPLAVQFRSDSADGLGIALDWAEVAGVGRVTPRARVLAGLGLVFLSAAALGLSAGGARAALAAVLVLLTALSAAVQSDRLGGLLAFANAGPPVALAGGLLAAGAWGLGRAWRAGAFGRGDLAVPALGLVAAVVALSHPFYYYPDVDTHARFVAAIGADPYLALDASEYQARTGAWTRTLAGRRIGFPYSAAFHLLAQPLVPLLGAAAAVKALAALALAFTLLLTAALARSLALPDAAAVVAQALLLSLPVTASRLTLALFPTLLGQCLELLLLVHLVRRYPHLSGARDAAAAAAVLALAQAGYTGSLLNVAAVVVAFSAWELRSGERRAALRLLLAWAAAAALVVLVQYARFVPVLLRDVLPAVGGAAQPQSPLRVSLSRFALFYDLAYPLLLLPGLLWLRRAPRHGFRLLVSTLVAGAALLLLRYRLGPLLRDAKEIELLAAPLALAAAAGLVWLWRRGAPGRLAALALAAAASGFGVSRAALAYAERFLALGR